MAKTDSSLFAIVDLDGHQHMVRVGEKLDIQHHAGEVDSLIEFMPMLVSDESGSATKIGTPHVAGAKVVAKILGHYQGEKVHVFRMKSKKHHDRTRNFKPMLTSLEIVSIA